MKGSGQKAGAPRQVEGEARMTGSSGRYGMAGVRNTRKAWLMAFLALGLAGPAQAQGVVSVEATVSNATTGVMNLSTPVLGFQQLATPSALTTGGFAFNYVALPFVADSTRTYVLGQTSAPVDTVLILYLNSFDPLAPGQNAVTGNDDSNNHAAVGAVVASCGDPSFCPQISFDLTRGQRVVMVASTFSSGSPLGLPMTFYTVPVGAPPVVNITANHTSADLASGAVEPVFSGGVLRLVDGALGYSFTVDGLGGTIDQNGAIVTFTGTFTNADGTTTPGTMAIINSGNGGRIVLSGASSFTGGFTVGTGAVLVVNGNAGASSGIQVLAGGTLGGSGIAPGVTIGSGGTLAPGNSIGTLGVAGSLVLSPGSRFAVEYSPAAADRVTVTGTTSLGGTLAVQPVDGVAPIGTMHRIIAGGGAVSGSFAAVEVPSTGVAPNARFDVLYGANSVDLVVTPQRYAALAPSRNQAEAGRALDAVRPAAGLRMDGAMAALFGALYPLNQAQAAAALTDISGEVATGASAIGYLAGGQFLTAMLDPLSTAQAGAMGTRLSTADGAAGPALAVWGTPFGAYSRTDGHAGDGSGRRSQQGAGFALGLDTRIAGDAVIGMAIAAGEGRAGLAGGRGTAKADYGQAGAYGRTQIGPFSLSAAGAFTHMEIDTSRSLSTLGGVRQQGDATAQVYSFRVEARHDGMAANGLRLMPLAAIQAQRVESQGYTEKAAQGTGGAVLAVPGQGSSAIRSEVGLHGEAATSLGGRPVRGFARAAWGHYFENDVSMTVGLASPETPRFTVRGARGDTDTALMSAGLETAIAPGVTLGARLDGEVSAHLSQVSGTMRLRYTF